MNFLKINPALELEALVLATDQDKLRNSVSLLTDGEKRIRGDTDTCAFGRRQTEMPESQKFMQFCFHFDIT